ncbi:hypothetical protein [Humitalea rosea]|uniref:hypothetical protein n=1 Tax=Humitalea rosea TaxID=990373 RepID=UPI0011B69E3E|nr:hypothetical protein [Humitalea rosea]
MTLQKLFRLRADGLLDGIVLSTWTPEVEREVEFVTWARVRDVIVVHSHEHADRGPTMLYTQARAVWLGLQAVPERADVLKLRTDKTEDKINNFIPLLAEGTAGAVFEPGPHAAYSRKVAVLWPQFGRPFYFGDQAHYSTRKDAAAALNFDARFHLTMEGLNPETKWWIRPICERFRFWREYFHNVNQMYAPDFIRAALAMPGAPAVPTVIYDTIAATLRGMADGFLFTVRNPLVGDAGSQRFRYSALFEKPLLSNPFSYEGVAAGRKTVSLRDAASLPTLVAGDVDPCPVAEGVKAALSRQEQGPPPGFDAEGFREWVDACENVPRAGPIYNRPFIVMPELNGGGEEDDRFMVNLVGRAAGGASEEAGRDLLVRLKAQLAPQVPVSRALFRAALDLERSGGPPEVVNAAIAMAAQQKINEAAVEFAIRAVERALHVDAELAERLLQQTCSRGIAPALVLRALLGARRTGGGSRAVEEDMTAARALESLDAAFLDAAQAGQSVRTDTEGLEAFARDRGAAPAYILDFRRRMARLISAGALGTESIPSR